MLPAARKHCDAIGERGPLLGDRGEYCDGTCCDEAWLQRLVDTGDAKTAGANMPSGTMRA